MTQIFHRSTNTLSKVSIFGAIFIASGLALLTLAFAKSPYMTQAQVAREQPVPFSHQHHVAGLGLDCRYCHTSVEDAAFAGIPPTQTCMNCHSQIWSDSPTLEAVRESFRSGEPIAWTRVHDLPHFAYFNHSIHLEKGIGCESCHGRVDRMPLMWREHSLHMDWCLACHRNPEKHVRPRSEVFTMGYEPEGAAQTVAAALIEEYDIQTLENCSVCHR
jgi:hypothetical protein